MGGSWTPGVAGIPKFGLGGLGWRFGWHAAGVTERHDDTDLERVTELFRTFSSNVVPGLPLYRHLSESIAEDPEVASLLLLAPPEQQTVPVLLLAAVHDILLAGEADPLRDWYDTITDEPRRVGEGVDDPWPHFRRLVLEHPGVAERLRTRSVQTNEVGRCAPLVAAFTHLAGSAPGAPPDGFRPLGLVELGASAGLNLLVDRYGYRFERSGLRDPRMVNPDSALVIDCALRGDGVPDVEDGQPHVASRVGVDLNPLDLSDSDDARWLVACQWPDEIDRTHRIRAAMALARGDAPTLLRGDAVQEVAALVDAVPDHALPVVFATWALAYLSDQRQRDLLAELDGIGSARDLSLVFAEQPVQITGMPVPERPDGRADGPPTALVAYRWRGGTRSEQRLGDMHPHGRWLEWLVQPG